MTDGFANCGSASLLLFKITRLGRRCSLQKRFWSLANVDWISHLESNTRGHITVHIPTVHCRCALVWSQGHQSCSFFSQITCFRLGRRIKNEKKNVSPKWHQSKDRSNRTLHHSPNPNENYVIIVGVPAVRHAFQPREHLRTNTKKNSLPSLCLPHLRRNQPNRSSFHDRSH